MNYFTLKSKKKLRQHRKYWEGNGCFFIGDLLPSCVRGQCHCPAFPRAAQGIPKKTLANELKQPLQLQCQCWAVEEKKNICCSSFFLYQWLCGRCASSRQSWNFTVRWTGVWLLWKSFASTPDGNRDHERCSLTPFRPQGGQRMEREGRNPWVELKTV